LVSKDEATWKLMESSPTVADQFKAQTEKCSLHFLVGAIEAVNRADQQYRMSRHQRLLIELLVMQIGSLDAAAADGAKKK
jgi:DNA polymerase-3 subunit gamma/tau